MKYYLLLAGLGLLPGGPALAQDLTNAGVAITVQPGTVFYVGAGGLLNQAGATVSSQGDLRVVGDLTNAGTLALGLATAPLTVGGNLLNTGTIAPGTSPVIFAGAADQLLTPGGASLYQLQVNKPTAGANTLRLAGDLTVTHQLQLLNGLVNTQSGGTVYTLLLPDGATLSGEAPGRYVRGALRIVRNSVSGGPVDFGHGAVLDPGSSNLGRVLITRVAGLRTDDVSRAANLNPATPASIDRIWTIAPAAAPSLASASAATPQLTLSWLPDDDNGLTDFSQAQLWQQAASGQPWASLGTANAGARSISQPLATIPGRFTVSGRTTGPLPVTLVDFTAQAEGPAAVRLRWATASELNSLGFTVERSLDGRAFAAVGSRAGAGTSATRHDYALLDNQLPAGATQLYYRLRQTDANGTSTYSPVRPVALAAAGPGFVVYPTRVAAGQAALYQYAGPAEPATLLVLDALGRPVRQLAVDGRTQGEVPLAGLAPGLYLLRYTTATASFGGRCVVE